LSGRAWPSRFVAPAIEVMTKMGASLVRPELTVRLFGPIMVEQGERRLGPRDFGGARPKQVLEILLAARGRQVPTERLAELLWGTQPPDNAAASLQTFVSVLRRHLSPDRGYSHQIIVTEPAAYRFAVERASIDIDRFDGLLEASGRASTEKARGLLEELLSLAIGEVLEDEPYADWAEELRGTYRGRVIGANLEAADAALASCDYTAGLGYAQAASAIDRLSERAHRTSMLALYAMGRTHEALDCYRRLRALLDGELGLEPTEPTRALQTAILRQEDVAALLPRPAAQIQLRSPGSPWLLFLGRRQELAALERIVRCGTGGCFSLALVEGESGVGKSRLLDELVATLPGVRIGRACCSALEQHLAYVPLAAALRDALSDIALDEVELPALSRILPELGLRSPAPDIGEVDALEAIVDLITRHAPVVLLLDDLQFADPQTIATLGYLKRRCAHVPGAIVATARPEEIAPDHPVRLLRPVETIHLEPLTVEELAPLGITEIHAQTGGHPAFVAERIAAGAQPDLRRSVGELMIARCRSEGAVAYRVLLAAATLEEPFEPEVLAALLASDPVELSELLEQLCDRRILRADGFGFRYRYAIVRDAVAASISPARRRLLQARADATRASQPLHLRATEALAAGDARSPARMAR
jgi:DNA-binding SARP family transcriptional activator